MSFFTQNPLHIEGFKEYFKPKDNEKGDDNARQVSAPEDAEFSSTDSILPRPPSANL